MRISVCGTTDGDNLMQAMFILSLMMLAMTEAPDTLSASQVSEYRFESPAVQTIVSERISSVPSYSVPDILRYSSGLQIKDYGGLGGLKTVNVRALGSQHTGIFIDGIKISNIQNGQVDLGRYSVEDLESVSVFNAQSSALLQSASELASSSTICLQTKKPDFSIPYEITLRGEYGSFDTGSAFLSASKRLSAKSYLKLSGDFRHTDGDYPYTFTNEYGADTTGRRKNSDLDSFRLEPSLYVRSGKSDWELKGCWFHSDRGLPGPVIRSASEFRNGNRQRDDNTFIQGSYRYTAAVFSLKIQGKYSYDYCNYLQDTVKNQSVRYQNLHYRQQEGYFSVSAAFRAAGFSCSVATDQIFSRLSSDVSGLSGKFRWSSLAAARATYRYGRLSAGASAVYSHSSDRDGRQYDAFSPYVSIQYSPGRFRFLAFWKNSFRLPTFNELYYVAESSANVAHVLEPEKVDQFDFTAAYSGSAGIWSGDFRADAYYNITRDKIVWLPVANQFVWSALNYGLVHGCGWDFSADNTLRFKGLTLSWLINYTYERSRDLSDPSSRWYGGQIAYIPLHSVSSTFALDWRDWLFSANFIFNSTRYRSSANIPSEALEAYACLDLMLSKTFRRFITAALSVCNATDARYETVSRYPMPGISCRLSLKFVFK